MSSETLRPPEAEDSSTSSTSGSSRSQRRRSGGGIEPYVGPRPFEPEHKSLFFGRDAEAMELMYHILAHDEVLIYSPSGAGKSSLINARLVPLLQAEGCEILPVARVYGPPPDETKLQVPNIFVYHVIRSWLKDCDPASSGKFATTSLAAFLQTRPRQSSEQSTPRVAIFDQFEELFTAYPDKENERRQLFEQIREAMIAEPLLRVVLSMREEYIAELKPYAAILPEKLRTAFRLERLGRKAALEAINEPLKNTHLSFAPGTAEKLVDNLQKGAPGGFVEAVHLQVVCQSLWQNLPPEVRQITYEDVQCFADVNQALANYYEKAIHTILEWHLDESITEGKLRRWFQKYLITPVGTRGSVFRGDLETGGIPNEIVIDLVDLHLVRGEQRANATWYELTHDRFIKPIQDSNQKWLAKRAGAEETRQRLQAAAERWIDNNRHEEDLLDLAELNEAQRWLKNIEVAELDASDAVQTLVKASEAAIRAQNEKVLQRWVSRLTATSILAATLAVVTCILFFVASANEKKAVKAMLEAEQAKVEAEQAEAIAEKAKEEADAARKREEDGKKKATHELALHYIDNGRQRVQNGDPAGAFLWFRNALDRDLSIHEPAELHNLRLGAVWRQLPRLSQLWRTSSTPNAELRPDVMAASTDFSPDGQFVIAAAGDQRATVGYGVIWAADGQGSPVFLPHHEGRVTYAAFSPDGQLAVTTSSGPGGVKGEARLWRFRGLGVEPELLKSLPHEFPVVFAAFSPDNKWLATASGEPAKDSGECQLLDITTLSDPHREPHYGMVTHVVFNRDGNRFATTSRSSVSEYGEARVYSIGGEGIKQLWMMPHDYPVNKAAFSPDGELLATAGGEIGATGELQLWPIGKDSGVTSEREMLKPRSKQQQGGAVVHVAFSPDGKLVATASHDNTARIIDWESNQERILRHGSSVFWTSFSPDGRSLATASRDWTARVWNADTGAPRTPPLHHNGTVSHCIFDSKGRYLLTAAKDIVRCFDLAANVHHRNLFPIDSVETVAVNDNGQLAVTFGGLAGRGPRVAQLRDSNLNHCVDLPHQQNLVQSFFSQDNEWIITISAEEQDAKSRSAQVEGARPTISVWDRQGNCIHELKSPRAFVNSVAVSCDRRYLAAGMGVATATSGQAFVWDLESQDPRPMPVNPNHNGAVLHVAFSGSQPNLFITASADDTARIWEIGADGNLAPRHARSESGAEKIIDCRHAADLVYATFSDDDQYLVTTSHDRHAKVWEAKTGDLIATLKHSVPAKRACFTPAKSGAAVLLVTAAFNGEVSVWDVRNQELITSVAVAGDIEHVRFADDRRGVWTISRLSQPGKSAGETRHRVEVTKWDLSWERTGIDIAYGRLAAAHELNMNARQLVAIEESANFGSDWKTVSDSKRLLEWSGASTKEWHQQSVHDAEFFEQWFAAIWHLNELVNSTNDPVERAGYLARRATAYAKKAAGKADFQNAVADYTEALKVTQDDNTQLSLLLSKAEACAELGDWEEAIASLLVSLPNKELRIHWAIAMLLLRENEMKEYENTGRICETLLPPDSDRMANRYNWLCALAPNFTANLNDPIARAEELAKRYPKERRYWNTLGAIHYRQGNYAEAIKQLDEARRVYKEYQRSRIELIGKDTKLSESAVATAMTKAAESTDDGVIWDWLILAMAHEKNGSRQDAEYWWNKSEAWYRDFKADRINTGPRMSWDQRIALTHLRKEVASVLRVAAKD